MTRAREQRRKIFFFYIRRPQIMKKPMGTRTCSLYTVRCTSTEYDDLLCWNILLFTHVSCQLTQVPTLSARCVPKPMLLGLGLSAEIWPFVSKNKHPHEICALQRKGVSASVLSEGVVRRRPVRVRPWGSQKASNMPNIPNPSAKSDLRTKGEPNNEKGKGGVTAMGEPGKSESFVE